MKKILISGLVALIVTAGQPSFAADYKLYVKTGTKSGAGTDSKVYVTLFGTEGMTGRTILNPNQEKRNPLENGETDTYIMSDQPEIGTLTGLRITTDLVAGQGGMGAPAVLGMEDPGWQLESITVSRLEKPIHTFSYTNGEGWVNTGLLGLFLFTNGKWRIDRGESI